MNCKDCGIHIEEKPGTGLDGPFAEIFAKFRQGPVSCDACFKANKEKKWIAECTAFWRAIAPESVKMPDDGRSSEIMALSDAFPASLDGKRNLMLLGPCRSGKTFAAWQCLLAGKIAGKSIGAVSALKFSRMSPQELSEAEYVSILLVDEFSKINWERREAAEAAFSLINSRSESRKITIFTGNASLRDMREKANSLSPDFAISVFSRIEESVIIKAVL